MPAKSNAAAKDVSVDDLTLQIDKLKQDIADLTDTMVELGASRKRAAVAEVAESAGEVRRRGEQAARDAAEAARGLGDEAGRAVRESPMASLAIAAAVGAAFGYFTARR